MEGKEVPGFKDGFEKAYEDEKRSLTISEFRRSLGIPLVLARKMIVWGIVEASTAADGTLRITVDELEETRAFLKHPWTKTRLYFRSLGPGLITGASDDDPSGIATYSSVGAQFGLSLLWLCLWTTPMMLAIQETCARIGVVTNKGLSSVLQSHYKKNIVYAAVILLIIANVANIGADIGAMTASLQLLVNLPFTLVAIGFAALTILLEIYVPYHRYVKILKWLTVSVLAYIVTGFIVQPDWHEVLKKTFSPEVRFTKEYIFAIVAFLGTTITPYLFFWQTSEEVEENHLSHAKMTPERRDRRITSMRSDVKFGMILSNLIAFFIVLTTASVLYKHGVTNIQSAEQAASALEPLVATGGVLANFLAHFGVTGGMFAKFLFAAGIIGVGLLAIPILAGASSYALSELTGWKEGLEKNFNQAKSFYIIIALSIIVGLLLNFIGINPMKALYYAAFLNGAIAVPLMAVIMVVGNDKKIMGDETHPGWVKFFGWMAVYAMGAAVILTFVLNKIQ
jgi:NRAMP (natural resistance-associated macrophage protein)-like metal ion transporter